MANKICFDPLSIYHSAIMNADGTINSGYVVLFKIIRVWLALMAVVTVGGVLAFYAAWQLAGEGRIEALIKVLTWYGVAVGAISSAIFVTSLPGIAAFIWSDSHTASVPAGVTPPAGVLPVQVADTKS